MKVQYGMVEEFYKSGDAWRRAYGIAIYDKACTDASATVLSSVHDITENEIALSELVEQCNALELSPIHFCDVIEDFMAQ